MWTILYLKYIAEAGFETSLELEPRLIVVLARLDVGISSHPDEQVFTNVDNSLI